MVQFLSGPESILKPRDNPSENFITSEATDVLQFKFAVIYQTEKWLHGTSKASQRDVLNRIAVTVEPVLHNFLWSKCGARKTMCNVQAITATDMAGPTNESKKKEVGETIKPEVWNLIISKGRSGRISESKDGT